MTTDRDTVLVETVRTRRSRLRAAFLRGELARRRIPDENLRRFAVGVVVAAFACVGCLGYAAVAAVVSGRVAAGR